MDQKTHDKGPEIRKPLRRLRHQRLKELTFQQPFQTSHRGAVWGRDELPRKTRSMLNLAMISMLKA